jgi:hypothetical protein
MWSSFASFSFERPNAAFALSNVGAAALALVLWTALAAVGLAVVNEERSVA